jgi:RNA recognition motif-containing protein
MRDLTKRLFVGPLPPDTTRDDITRLFSRFGGRDPFVANGGFAYVSVDTDKAQEALADGVEWRGRRLTCRVMVKGSTISSSPRRTVQDQRRVRFRFSAS